MPHQGIYYLIEVYLPVPIDQSPLVQSLRLQWSTTFTGTTMFEAEGTYLSDPPEQVRILRIYVPMKYDPEAVRGYFRDRRIELETNFPEQQSFLITFAHAREFL